MIETMKAVTVVTTERSKTDMLCSIRDLGVMHIKEKKNADPVLSAQFLELQKTKQLLMEYKKQQSGNILSKDEFEKFNKTVVKAVENKKYYTEEKNKTTIEADRLRVWGNFDTSDIRYLQESGIVFHIFKIGKKELEIVEKDNSVVYVRLAPVEKMEVIAVIGNIPDSLKNASEFIIPSDGLSSLESRISDLDKKIQECDKILENAAGYVLSYDKYIASLSDEVIYSAVSATVESSDSLVVLSGYIPLDDEENFRKLASSDSWAFIISEVSPDDDRVPTKIKYNRITRLMEPVFNILGTVPGYREYDISFWFLCFFTLFFAMIIGDAGYGFCFLAVAVALNIKQKKTSNLVMLLYVLSGATIVWGAVTGTWFGLESAMNLKLFRFFVIPAISNYPEKFGYSGTLAQNNVMQFCFMIGTVHMSLACIQSIRTKWKAGSFAWLADCGWLLSINGIYYIVLLLVIGADLSFANIVPFVVLGFVLVVFFGGMSPDKTFGEGLKTGLGGAFTTFLNTISAFGNVMSYIRLFAVGMASLAIAQSFNSMAGGMHGILFVLGVAVFILGHVLNLVMGLLSVIVHGVRLNLLEYSNQLGMEWSGIAYEPFKRNV